MPGYSATAAGNHTDCQARESPLASESLFLPDGSCLAILARDSHPASRMTRPHSTQRDGQRRACRFAKIATIEHKHNMTSLPCFANIMMHSHSSCLSHVRSPRTPSLSETGSCWCLCLISEGQCVATVADRLSRRCQKLSQQAGAQMHTSEEARFKRDGHFWTRAKVGDQQKTVYPWDYGVRAEFRSPGWF